ncbi:MAG: translation elongation factor 4 [Eubacteriales bacterium]|nr:translation elongation factor 4 [Eubacteriales bacterium]MCI6979055.1 translation elongation factor 4 [Clostridiales bacterium]MDD6721178.1 translation elongation factor 4 [Clostridiales bacterium]MDY5694660.1 translation elongation factor 4 [Eubacteriales bacterium]HZK45420.1 translation elongation factor 4 [Clostridia bacterium]
MAYERELIRNFCIIAHIDHGKSTLADRMIEMTDTVALRDMEAQLLDNMDIERERGITIKSSAVRMFYTHKDGKRYMFNLIDTPGHVDFNYEVSRSLAACEGAVLVVDATQGIEAQTLANVYLALDNSLEIVPVINKIDLPSADAEHTKKEIEDVIGLPAEDAPCISAKTGLNVEQVLAAIVDMVPPPKGEINRPLKALIFDSVYDNYKGALSYVRVVDGIVKPGMRIRYMATGNEFEVTEVGVFSPSLQPIDALEAGEVGYISASIKNVRETKVGDTITDAQNPAAEPLPGYKQANPMVFCGIYPADGADYENLKDALDKLLLNDASLSYEPETSMALGFGFRCGFLGLLHMEIIQERLEREFDLDLVTTSPSVIYKVVKTNGEELMIDNPTNLPPAAEIAYMEEPMVRATIMSPSEYVGTIMELCQEKRGVFEDMKYIEEGRVNIFYELPLNEIIYDFFDQLKSRSRGYASFDYELKEYARSELVKLDFLLNGDMCDALSTIVHKDKAYSKGRAVAEKLQEVIPRQQFEIPIQAAIGGKIIARETVRAVRKDVLAKCYGGDITRKKKLLEKQKEGKKRMRQIGTVSLPSEAFMSVLKIN